MFRHGRWSYSGQCRENDDDLEEWNQPLMPRYGAGAFDGLQCRIVKADHLLTGGV
jgi:hypothetical protein